MSKHTSNNKYFDCPPRMDDARHFTDYRPNRDVNNKIRHNNKIDNSYEYRMFLTNQGKQLMLLNQKYTCEKNCCSTSSCKKPYNIGTMLPEQQKQSCNKSSCNYKLNDIDGLGIGRVYSSDPDFCNDWPKKVINGEPYNCNFNPTEAYNYAGDREGTVGRYTVQDGGVAEEGGDPKYYGNQ